MKDGDTLAIIGEPPVSVSIENLCAKTCFGRFSKMAPECKACTAPVVLNSKLLLFREACDARTRGASVSALVALSAGEVRQRLEQGRGLVEIWQEVLGDSDPRAYGRDARTLLRQRLDYLVGKYELTFPELPTTAELLNVYCREGS